jgi:hypothetical protein
VSAGVETVLIKSGFPFSVLIHSRTDTRGFANAKFDTAFEGVSFLHCARTSTAAGIIRQQLLAVAE